MKLEHRTFLIAALVSLLSPMSHNLLAADDDGKVPLLTLDQARTLETTLPYQKNVAVTKHDYAFAQLDVSMENEAKLGAVNAFYHHRKPMELDKQPAVLMNRDTLYSFAIVDATHGFNVVVPKGDGRYISIHVMQHDHVTDNVYYGGGTYTIDPKTVTNFVVINIRIQVNPNDPADVAKANAIQDQYKIVFPAGYTPKKFKPIDWNKGQLKALQEQYVKVADKRGVSKTSGARGTIPQEDINVGAAVATGLLPDQHAWYSFKNYKVKKDTCYTATYSIPGMTNPTLGFYSMTIYGNDLFLHTEEGSSLSNHEIVPDASGKTFTLHFGTPQTCGKEAKNVLIAPTDDWTLAFRVYMPDKAIQNNEYQLPEPRPIQK